MTVASPWNLGVSEAILQRHLQNFKWLDSLLAISRGVEILRDLVGRRLIVCELVPAGKQRNNNVKTTSPTSFWRNKDVIIASLLRYVSVGVSTGPGVE